MTAAADPLAPVALPEPWPMEPVGDRCLLVRLGSTVDLATNARVHALVQRLREQPIAGVRDVVPAFNTLALHYRPECFGEVPFEGLKAELLARLATPLAAVVASTRMVQVPVCYDGDFAPDLADVAQRCGLSVDEVIQRHMASDLRVYMLGFTPGFAFIGGLDPALAMPRRSTPRTHIPPGSVAIAREQTCIYPLDTPGGWNIIGRSPVRLFDAAADKPCLLGPGDAVRFVRINAAQYQSMREAQA